ncbi:MAG: DUF2950 domain-containing protein [Betaproteobacteria bacterium]|nr:MAG: DUF2950 domain-containing protein [Betaproteobacteria bacterium]
MNRDVQQYVSFAIAMAVSICIGNVGSAYAADSPVPAAAAKKAAAQKAFATPEELFQALADAAKTNDSKALVSLLGSKGDSLVNSGDAVRDKQRAESFAADYAEKHSTAMDGDAKATLVVGKQDWPMPIPAVKGPRGWTLDTDAGAREILARRIGQNELDAIQVVEAIVDAEHDYASEDHDADGLREYTAKFMSSPGKKDGLYWPTKEGEPPSPLGPLAAHAAGEGYKGQQGTPTPFHGYYYRLLTAQGKDAPGGALAYLAHGRMIGGFALVAYPATYGNSGIMTFMVNHKGVVYQKDLGPNTVALARAIKTYNPDSSWKPVR